MLASPASSSRGGSVYTSLYKPDLIKLSSPLASPKLSPAPASPGTGASLTPRSPAVSREAMTHKWVAENTSGKLELEC